MRCPNCGTENNEDARYCKSCAAPQTPSVPVATAPAPAQPVAPAPPFPPRRRRQPQEDFLGLLSFAFFLAAVAVVFSLNPNLIEGLGRWGQLVSSNHTVFIRPPESVIVSAAWFFGILGSFEFVSAFLRWSLRWTPLRTLSRVLSGFGDLVFAALLLRYSDKAISGGVLITALVGMFAAFLMIYVTLGVYWSTSRRVPALGAAEPPARQ